VVEDAVARNDSDTRVRIGKGYLDQSARHLRSGVTRETLGRASAAA
jgi:hypothetical protein